MKGYPVSRQKERREKGNALDVVPVKMGEEDFQVEVGAGGLL